MLDDLILLRLLAANDVSRGETRSRVAADLRPYLTGKADDGLAEAVERLARNGRLQTGGRGAARLCLTDAGRAHVRAAFGITGNERPARPGWRWWRDRYAVPRALGVGLIESADALRAALLRRYFLAELPSSPRPGNLLATVDLVLAKRLRAPQAGAGALRTAALRAWTAGEEIAPAAAKTPAGLPADQKEFAALVNKTARGCPTGRFGDNKVFVSHVWNRLVAAGHADPQTERDFKGRLVRANTAGLVRLSRADLAGAHDARDVRASEISYLGETFHFLRLD